MKEKLQEDIKNAMRAKDQPRLTVLRMLMSELKNIEINTREPLTPELCISTVQKEIKKRRDALEFAEKAGRAEIVEQNNSEIALLQSYLGEQMGEDKLREIISALIASGSDNIGKIMGALNKDYKGKFEGKRASELIKELLGN